MTQVSGRGFHRSGYATGDAAEGHDYLRALYTDFDVTIDGTTDEFQLRSDVLQFGAAAISRLRHSMAVTMFPRDGLGWPGIFQIRYPTLKIEVGHRDFRLGAGDAIAVRQHEPYRAAWNTLDADVTMLDPAMITDVAAEITGRTSPVTFEFATAVSPLAAAHWHQTVTLVQRVALANAAHTNGALLADDLSRLFDHHRLDLLPQRHHHRRHSPTDPHVTGIAAPSDRLHRRQPRHTHPSGRPRSGCPGQPARVERHVQPLPRPLTDRLRPPGPPRPRPPRPEISPTR